MATGTFEQFLLKSTRQGHTNIVFEWGMYSLSYDFGQLLSLFAEASVPFGIIGGLAVNAHLLAASKRNRCFLTDSIDLLINRADLPAIIQSASSFGYEHRQMIGGYALIAEGQELSEAVHMLFAGEKRKSTYPALNPELDPKDMQLFERTVPVAPLRDLLILKLNSLRLKDVVHLEILDEVGFITPALEQGLPDALRERLQIARRQFETDVE